LIESTNQLTERARSRLRRFRLLDQAYKKFAYAHLRQLQTARIMQYGRFAIARCFEAEFVLDLAQLHDFMMLRAFESAGCYESGTTRTLLQSVRPGMRVVDVGANNGYYSVLMAKRVGDSGQVFAFEPSPNAFSRLLSNVGHNGVSRVVKCANVALSDRFGKSLLYASAVEDGLDSLVVKTDKWAEVTTSTLDRELTDLNIDFVKIDAEGSEASIMAGMTKLIERNPRLEVIVEWNPDLSSTTLPAKLIPRFNVFSIDETTATCGDLRPVLDWTELEFCNLFCRPA
jgi:FkbM family methyltransferase